MTSRQEFEQWIKSEGAGHMLEKYPSGNYVSQQMNLRWEGWQAHGKRGLKRELEELLERAEALERRNKLLTSLLEKLDSEIGDAQYPGSPRQEDVREAIASKKAGGECWRATIQDAIDWVKERANTCVGRD